MAYPLFLFVAKITCLLMEEYSSIGRALLDEQRIAIRSRMLFLFVFIHAGDYNPC